MNKIKNTFLILFISFSTSFISAEIKYKINGRTDLINNGQQVMLFTFQREDILRVDTTVIKNGEFTFEGKSDTTLFATITSGNYPLKVLRSKLLLENGQINVFLDTISKIGGTKFNNIYNTYLIKYNTIYSKLYDLSIKTGLDSIATQKNEIEIRENWTKLHQLERDFLKENITNTLGLIIFKEKYDKWGDFTFDEVYSQSDNQLKNDSDIIKYVRWREKEKRKNSERNNKLQELAGKSYTDFSFLTTEGKMIKLSDYIGKSKYILLDFWASWCGPCIKEQPIIKEIYEQYKNKGFNVIGISLDSNDNAWKNAITKIQSTWPQLLDLKAGDSGIEDAYKFKGIPHLVLIDQNGIILVSSLNGELLKQYLLNLYKVKK